MQTLSNATNENGFPDALFSLCFSQQKRDSVTRSPSFAVRNKASYCLLLAIARITKSVATMRTMEIGSAICHFTTTAATM